MNFKVPGAEFPRPFGNYLLLQSLARGGMGEVFLAKHGGIAGIEKYCVVKTLRGHYTLDREYVTRFIDEARVVVQLNHRNICQIFDVGRVGRKYFLAMEFIIGRDMRTIQHRLATLGEEVGTDIALHIVGEMLEALDYAHRQSDPATGEHLRLVHRDVSPQNIMVNFEGEVKLIDFGLAQSTQKVEKTQPHVVMGKMQYMSPEQARGDAVDGRADLFAAAVLTYEMVSRERFYEGMSFDEVWQVAGRGGYRPRKFDALDPKLRSILDKAFAADLDERFATCADFREALMGYRYDNRLRASARTVREFMLRVFNEESDAHREMLARYQNVSVMRSGGYEPPEEKSKTFAKAPAGEAERGATSTSTMTSNSSSVVPLRSDEPTQSVGASSHEEMAEATQITGFPAQHASSSENTRLSEEVTSPPHSAHSGSSEDAFGPVAATLTDRAPNAPTEPTQLVRSDAWPASNEQAAPAASLAVLNAERDEDVAAAFGPSRKPLFALGAVVALLLFAIGGILLAQAVSGDGNDRPVVVAATDEAPVASTGRADDEPATVQAGDAPTTVRTADEPAAVAAVEPEASATDPAEPAVATNPEPVTADASAKAASADETPRTPPPTTKSSRRARSTSKSSSARKSKRSRTEDSRRSSPPDEPKPPTPVIKVTYPKISSHELQRVLTEPPFRKRLFLESKKCKARGASCAGGLVKSLGDALGTEKTKTAWSARANQCIKKCARLK